MTITVGTFNLNNLFSRYNFKGEIRAIRDNDTSVDSDILYSFEEGDLYRIRTYMGRLVKGKDPDDTQTIADRILAMDVDILAVQEVEDIDTLTRFNRDYLNGLYSSAVLIEGNDPRLIDVGLLSKYPIGAITSWKEAVHPDQPDEPVFGRDVQQIQILNRKRSRLLFTIFNNHLKSHFVDFREDRTLGEQANSLRRQRQVEVLARIVKSQTRPNSKFIILGDMNDPPVSPDLMPLINDSELNLANALENPTETRHPKADNPPPATPSWTHRFKESGRPAEYELYDQIWLSPSLADKQAGAWIDRRTKHGGDGSDHDPAWIALDL
jgi:endonuclease/exonuclease/phosphatase family metal-dependent hydrolase